jgi:hypothetical protein
MMLGPEAWLVVSGSHFSNRIFDSIQKHQKTYKKEIIKMTQV